MKPVQTTVYTEILKQLATLSAKTDNGKITENDFVNLQKIGAHIIRANLEGRFTRLMYKGLNDVYQVILTDMRFILRDKNSA